MLGLTLISKLSKGSNAPLSVSPFKVKNKGEVTDESQEKITDTSD